MWWTFRLFLMVAMLGVGGCAAFRPDAARTTDVFKLPHPLTRDLEKTIQDKQIRTLVNFRGFEPQKKWYRDEVEICRKAQVRHVDATVNPDGPDREEVIALLEIFHSAPQPIALCDDWTGAQSGFAMGLYRLAILKQDREAARRELPFWESQNAPIDRFRHLDQFLSDWRDEREFYSSYQLPDAKRGPRPETRPNPPVAGSANAKGRAELPERDYQSTGSPQDRPIDRKDRSAATRDSDTFVDWLPADPIPAAWASAPTSGRMHRSENWTTRIQATNAWNWLTNARGSSLVWTERGGLQEAATIRDCGGMIVDSPVDSGPKLWDTGAAFGRSRTRLAPVPKADRPSRRPDHDILLTSHWEIDEPESRPPAQRPTRPVGLGRPIPRNDDSDSENHDR